MSVENLNVLPTKEELVQQFERRGEVIESPYKNEPQRDLKIKNKENFQRNLKNAGMVIFSDLKKEKTISPEAKCFSAQMVDPDVPLVLVGLLSNYDGTPRFDLNLLRTPNISKEMLANPQSVFEEFQEKSATENLVSEMGFTPTEQGDLSLVHRRVWSWFKEQKDLEDKRVPIGSSMLEVAEEIPLRLSKLRKEKKELEINTAQIDTMRWAIRNGYEPKTEEDKNRWDNVLAGDMNIQIEDLQAGRHNYLIWKDSKEKGKGNSWKDFARQVRITFVKKFVPEREKDVGDEFHDVVDTVNQSVDKILGIEV